MKRIEEISNAVAGALESKVEYCLSQIKNEMDMVRIYRSYQKENEFEEEIKRHEIRAEVYRDIVDVLKKSVDIWRA